MHPHEHVFRGCFRITLLLSAVFVCAAGAAAFIAWKSINKQHAPTGYAGSPQRGSELVIVYGCPACHEIPGVSPRSTVGPPLDHIASRSYLAGRIANEPIGMQQWLRDPQQIKPGTAMPNLGVTVKDASDIATYLATLK